MEVRILKQTVWERQALLPDMEMVVDDAVGARWVERGIAREVRRHEHAPLGSVDRHDRMDSEGVVAMDGLDGTQTQEERGGKKTRAKRGG